MEIINYCKGRIFFSFLAILFLSHCLLTIRDTQPAKAKYTDNYDVLAVTNPKKYFISQLAPLLSVRNDTNDTAIVTNMNRVFEELGIEAYVITDTLTRREQSVEFLVYVNKYGKVFPVRFTPLIDDLAQLISEENFRLEVKPFASWMPVTIDQLLG